MHVHVHMRTPIISQYVRCLPQNKLGFQILLRMSVCVEGGGGGWGGGGVWVGGGVHSAQKWAPLTIRSQKWAPLTIRALLQK